MQLSPHFSLAELTRSSLAARLGIDNAPPETVIGPLTNLAVHILEPVRQAFGPFSPESGYRGPALNQALGSKPTSQHLKGEAADFEVPGIRTCDLAEWIDAHLEFDQLILEFYRPGDPHSGWVHCSYASPERNRRQILTVTALGRTLQGIVK